LVVDLREGVRLAMEKNERLRMARAALDKSQQQVREARADGLPQFDLSLNYSRNWLLPSFVFDTPAGRQTVKIGTHNNITGVLSVRQPLYVGGRVRAALASAQLFRDYVLQGERGVRQQVSGEVESSFYDLLLGRELVRVSELALERARANLSQVRALRRAGRVADYDLIRAQVQVSSLKADSIQADNNCHLAEMVFKNVIGLELGRPVAIVGNFREETRLDLGSLDELLETGVARRPEMNQVERQIRMRERAIQAEKAGTRPSVDLVTSGQTQFQSDAFDVGDKEWRRSWSSGIVVQFPLFDGRATRARVDRARVALRRAELERDQLERRVRLEITQAWLDFQEAGARLAAQRETVEQAEKGLAVAESRYAGGTGTQLEILDAQLSLVQARTGLAAARRDRALALMSLEGSVGVLGEEERP